MEIPKPQPAPGPVDDENVPMDVTAEQAKAIVQAALHWAADQPDSLSRNEWRLLEACEAYGDKYKGLRAR